MKSVNFQEESVIGNRSYYMNFRKGNQHKDECLRKL